MYFIYRNAELAVMTTNSELARQYELDGEIVVTRHDLHTASQVEVLAEQASKLSGERWIGVDHGDWVTPRRDVIRAPRVGDKVSYAFNGDSYPCGQIARISKNLRRVETDTGEIFWRRQASASWIKGGTWCMVPGHVDERNPCF